MDLEMALVMSLVPQILLIHPEITEGVSLKGTRQMHLLEVPSNRSFYDQITARVIRYRSHSHLPEKDRKVEIYIWKNYFGFFDLDPMKARRVNWIKNFDEMFYYGSFGEARNKVDPNAEEKKRTPDEVNYEKSKSLSGDISKLKELLSETSIDKLYAY